MKQYHDLLKTILEAGSYKEAAREGMPGSLSLFGYQSRYNLTDSFPILTTKKMYWKGIVAELLWFLRGDTNIKFLDEHNVTKMWHEDAYNFYIKKFKDRVIYGNDAQVALKQAEEPMSFEQFCQLIRNTKRENLPYFETINGRYTLGDCGYQYGKVWRAWPTNNNIVTGHTGMYNEWGAEIVDQVAKVIKSLKKGPYGRRHLITAIDPAHDEELALYWCHALFQFNCREIGIHTRCLLGGVPIGNDYPDHEHLDALGIPRYYLDCQLYQRSCDVLLGVPFNISSYALLTYVIAKVVNMVPGEFIHTYGDVHIYDNHMDAVKEQLERDPSKYKLPKLELGGDWSKTANADFSDLGIEDFKLVGYESYPKLESDTTLSTGMKK